MIAMPKPAVLAIVIVGCGVPVVTTPTPSGCPSAAAVALAQWNPRTVVGSPPYRGTPKDAAWLVRLGYRDDGADDAPDPGAVPGYELAKLGLGPLPDQVWLLRPGLAPCPSRVTGYVAERIDDGPVSIRISAVLAGCAAPLDDERWPTAWISFAGAPPIGCRVEVPAARTTSAEVLPDAWEPGAPTEPCDDCTRSWALDAIDGEPAIDAVTVTDLAPAATACDAVHHDTYTIYAEPKDAPPVALALPTAAVDLAGALIDPSGLRAVLAIGVDTWAAYDVGADGALGAGRTVQHFIAHEEDGRWHSLAESCGP